MRLLHRLQPSQLLCTGCALHYPAVFRVVYYAPGWLCSACRSLLAGWPCGSWTISNPASCPSDWKCSPEWLACCRRRRRAPFSWPLPASRCTSRWKAAGTVLSCSLYRIRGPRAGTSAAMVACALTPVKEEHKFHSHGCISRWKVAGARLSCSYYRIREPRAGTRIARLRTQLGVRSREQHPSPTLARRTGKQQARCRQQPCTGPLGRAPAAAL